jgi:hypothetical protein
VIPFHLLQRVDLARPCLLATADTLGEGEDCNSVIAASIALVLVKIFGVVCQCSLHATRCTRWVCAHGGEVF